MADKIASKKASKNMQFGGLSKRFNEPDPEQSTPGPGAYLSVKKKHYKKANAVFESRTKRNFEESQKPDNLPSFGLYNVNKYKEISPNKNRIEKGGGSNLFRFLRLNPGKKPIFQSVSPRFSTKSILVYFK